MSAPGDVTRLLRAYGAGDERAFEQLVPLVYDDLRQIAGRLLRGRNRGQTLDATAVVHEAWLKLAQGAGAGWNDRGHFLAVAARAMRQVTVDYARERAAAKRGGALQLVTLEEEAFAAPCEAEWVLAVDEALAALARHDERLARVVECRFFAGLTEPETAEALGVSLRTVQRSWPRARAWLKEALRAGRGAVGDGVG
jgi:RNA polymerase sigma factor (TIGR02999 family)